MVLSGGIRAVIPMVNSTISPQELADRQALGARYEASQELAKIQDKIRGHRSAINTLIREEKELLRRAQELDDIVHGREQNNA